MNNIPLRRALLLALLSLVTGSAFATRAKARFDSTHFQDQADVQVKVVATDEKGKTYSNTWTGKAYNKGLMIWCTDFDAFGGPDKSAALYALGALERTNHSSTGVEDDLTAAEIAERLKPNTVLFAEVHGDPRSFSDCSANENSPDQYWVTSEQVTESVAAKAANPASTVPGYNLVFLNACRTTRDCDGSITYRFADAFGVTEAQRTQEGRSFLGWPLPVVNFLHWVWSCVFYRALGDGKTVNEAVTVATKWHSGRAPIWQKMNPEVRGDGLTRLKGVYGGDLDDWLIEWKP